MRLEKKVALITGGAHGMGASESILFAREGARVIVAGMAKSYRWNCGKIWCSGYFS